MKVSYNNSPQFRKKFKKDSCLKSLNKAKKTNKKILLNCKQVEEDLYCYFNSYRNFNESSFAVQD